jgi:hypothetical protein
MRGTVALIREQGQDFAVLAVKDSVFHNPTQREETLRAAQVEFGVRTAILGERQHRTYGPDDIVRWLKGVSVEQLPWREFTLPG